MKIKGKYLSDQLRSALRQCNCSIYEVARMTRIDEGNLNRFKNGTGGLRLDSVDRLAQFLRLRLVKS